MLSLPSPWQVIPFLKNVLIKISRMKSKNGGQCFRGGHAALVPSSLSHCRGWNKTFCTFRGDTELSFGSWWFCPLLRWEIVPSSSLNPECPTSAAPEGGAWGGVVLPRIRTPYVMWLGCPALPFPSAALSEKFPQKGEGSHRCQLRASVFWGVVCFMVTFSSSTWTLSRNVYPLFTRLCICKTMSKFQQL